MAAVRANPPGASRISSTSVPCQAPSSTGSSTGTGPGCAEILGIVSLGDRRRSLMFRPSTADAEVARRAFPGVGRRW